MKMKRIAVYLVGLFTGAGIAVAVVGNAADSIIPFTFKDGQVISADTLNDLFASINSSTQGISNASELVGTWACSTYDPTSASNKTPGMPNSNFSADAATGLQKLVNTWTFTNGGKSLSMNLATLGGISASTNNTGVCSTTTYEYTTNVVESTLMLSGSTACISGTGYILPIVKTSPYKFRVVVDKTVICWCRIFVWVKVKIRYIYGLGMITPTLEIYMIVFIVSIKIVVYLLLVILTTQSYNFLR